MKKTKNAWMKLGDTAKIFILCFAFYFICKTLKN